jgi:hypothetical protein
VTNPTVVSGPSPAPSSIAYFGTRQPARPLVHAPRAVAVVKQRERTLRRVHEHWLPRLTRPKGGACSRPRTSVHGTSGTDTGRPAGWDRGNVRPPLRTDVTSAPDLRSGGRGHSSWAALRNRGAGRRRFIDGTSSDCVPCRCCRSGSCGRGLPAVSTRQAVQDMVEGRDARATSPVPVARAAGGPHRPRPRPLRSQMRQRARLGRQEAGRTSEAASRVGRRRCDGCRSSSSRHGWNARAGSRDAGRGASPTPGDLATEAADA